MSTIEAPQILQNEREHDACQFDGLLSKMNIHMHEFVRKCILGFFQIVQLTHLDK